MKEVFVLLSFLVLSDGTYTDRTYPAPTLFTTKQACQNYADMRNSYDGMADLFIIQRAIRDGRKSLPRMPAQMVFGCESVKIFEENDNVSR